MTYMICSKHCRKGSFGPPVEHCHYAFAYNLSKRLPGWVTAYVEYSPAYTDPGSEKAKYWPLTWMWTVYAHVPTLEFPTSVQWFRDRINQQRWHEPPAPRPLDVPIATGEIRRRWTPSVLAEMALEGRGWKAGRLPGFGDPVIQQAYATMLSGEYYSGWEHAAQKSDWITKFSAAGISFLVRYSDNIGNNDVLQTMWLRNYLERIGWYSTPAYAKALQDQKDGHFWYGTRPMRGS
jgi:hypothetical protein